MADGAHGRGRGYRHGARHPDSPGSTRTALRRLAARSDQVGPADDLDADA